MANTTYLDTLQNLKGVLYKLLSDPHVRNKYTNALEVAIAQLSLETIFLETEYFRVDVESRDDGVSINIATSDGIELENYEYLNGDLIDDGEAGEA